MPIAIPPPPNPIRTLRDGTLTLLNTPEGLLIDGEVWGPTLAGVRVTPERAAEARATVHALSVPFDAGDFSWTPEESEPTERRPVEFSFSATTRDIGSASLSDVLAAATPHAAPTYTVTLTYTATNPSISDLRQWARATSTTRWRRRSIASWRHAWRVRAGRRSVTLHDVAFSVGYQSPHTLTIEAVAKGPMVADSPTPATDAP